MPLDVSLDHVGFIVQDLNAGARIWERLGFQLSPVSPQMGLNDAGEFEPWATANRCAVFETGYLELIGVHRPGLKNPWTAQLARFEGAHIAAFRVACADETYASMGDAARWFAPPVQRRRDAPYFADGTWGQREMRFRNIFSHPDTVAEARYIIIEHQTPDVLWQPALLNHPNGARAFRHMCFVAPIADACHARLNALGRSDGAGTFVCPNGGTVECIGPDAFRARYAGEGINADAAIGSCTIEVSDLDQTRACLSANGVPFHDATGCIWLSPAHAGGTILEFSVQE
ncbi:MAG: VOC family protein [Pseudomonadota bacterium]